MSKVGELIKEALMEAIHDNLNESSLSDKARPHPLPDAPKSNKKQDVSNHIRDMINYHVANSENHLLFGSGNEHHREEHSDYAEDYEDLGNQLEKIKTKSVPDKIMQQIKSLHDGSKERHNRTMKHFSSNWAN